MSIPIQQLLNEAVNEKREKKEITSWHASKLGLCLRGTYLQRLGKEPDKPFDDRTLRVFSVGKQLEDWLIGKLKTRDDIKIEEQVRVEDKELNVSGYADFVAEYKGEKRVYEVKSKNSRAFTWMVEKGQGAPRHNMQQLWIYLWLLNIEHGSLIYLSKDDLRVVEYPVERSNETLKAEVLGQLQLLNTAWGKKDITLLPLQDAKDWTAKYCSYHKQCKSK